MGASADARAPGRVYLRSRSGGIARIRRGDRALPRRAFRPTDSVAIGITPNVTAATGGAGHWRGTRIVDGIGGKDKDIFLTGGKENDVTSWNVGPGSIGSSKYDVTQAYLANNQINVYFGMERRGNNGTRAFDFEFNQFASSDPYIPNRTVGDVLITFEMKGSGGSGSADPSIFVWNGTAYAPMAAPPGVVTRSTTPKLRRRRGATSTAMGTGSSRPTFRVSSSPKRRFHSR
jgi:hypothetical protein